MMALLFQHIMYQGGSHLLLNIVLYMIMICHCQGMIQLETYVKVASMTMNENITNSLHSESVIQCSAACTQQKDCNAFNWISSNPLPTCQLIKSPEHPSLSVNSSSALYMPRNVHYPLKGNLDGYFGAWSNDFLCQDGSYVAGFLSWYYPFVGSGLAHDDCGLQGLELFCQTPAGIEVGSVKFFLQYLDSTKYGKVSCPSGDFVSGFKIKLADRITNWDEEGMLNIIMECHTSKNLIQSNSDTSAGTWSSLVRCPPNMRMCGMRVKYVAPSATVTDNTCYNEIVALCCFIKL